MRKSFDESGYFSCLTALVIAGGGRIFYSTPSSRRDEALALHRGRRLLWQFDVPQAPLVDLCLKRGKCRGGPIPTLFNWELL